MVFLLLQIANVALWALQPVVRIRASLAAASLSLAAALTLSALSTIEHTRCIRPSFVINAYLLATLPLDAAKVRTLWLRTDNPLIAGIALSILTVKLVVLIIEAREKRSILLSPYSDQPSEVTSGFYAGSLFWWLSPIFLLGYKSVLRDVDLFRTDNSLTSDSLRHRFQAQWLRRVVIPSPPLFNH